MSPRALLRENEGDRSLEGGGELLHRGVRGLPLLRGAVGVGDRARGLARGPCGRDRFAVARGGTGRAQRCRGERASPEAILDALGGVVEPARQLLGGPASLTVLSTFEARIRSCSRSPR